MAYAIIEHGGKQHFVEPGSSLTMEKIEVPEGSEVIFDRVLLVKTDAGQIHIATEDKPIPFQVVGSVLRHGRGEKIVVFKKRRKETYKKKQGHRQALTLVRVDSIRSLSSK